ncbi:ribonuclease P protein component [Spiroplasma culicicola]|uniref:Ribonuclease P protein component n=1 Tax=Spiroplasma culicicola AES-1 TaxID=1276246 RepID=W6A8X1_9MOLU|nr:ribonuclease P protein component [Spiroplasma culicicola]AHI53411.1 ribonuclease P (protein C5) [Spiroplasma culicicola AES-1]
MKNINIIKKNHEFQKIISKRHFLKSKTLIIYFLEAKDNFKYGISVGKKLGNAVIRNKVKRQIRMMIYNKLINLKEEKKHIIIMARNEYLKRSYEYNSNELNRLLTKIC